MGENFDENETWNPVVSELSKDCAIDHETLIDQLKSVAQNPDALRNADAAQRREIQRLAVSAARSLEEPYETMMRHMYAPLPLVCTRIGQDHNIFAELVESKTALSMAELCEASGLAPPIVDSLLEYMCTQDMCCSVGQGRYTATKLTHYLNEPLLRNAAIHFHNSCLPGFAAFNKALKAPRSGRTAFQSAFNTDEGFYDWLKRNPLEYDAFHHLMEKLTSGLNTWLDVVDFPSEFAHGITADEVALVDVGGGIGHQSKGLKERYPELSGRIIVQDLPDVLEQALSVPGIENMIYDYRTEQPVKNARVYYFRAVFHNNDDVVCLEILRSTIPAMSQDSIIVIDEKVLPDDKDTPATAGAGAGAEYGSAVSLAMIMIFNSQERREAHWRRLLRSAGLAVREIRKYTHVGDSVIIAAKQ